MPGYSAQRHEAGYELDAVERHHDQVGGALQRQDDQVLVQKQEALKGKLQQDGQQPKAGQLGNLESQRCLFINGWERESRFDDLHG